MYTVVIHKKVIKEIDRIPDVYAIKIAEVIYNLAENPRPDGCRKLIGYNDYYRIRVADYRIIYSIKDSILYIEIIKVAHRKEGYKRK